MTEEHSLLTGSVPKKLAVFAFPLLLANILQSFYNVVDMHKQNIVCGLNSQLSIVDPVKGYKNQRQSISALAFPLYRSTFRKGSAQCFVV